MLLSRTPEDVPMPTKTPVQKPAKAAKSRTQYESDARTPDDCDGNEEHARVRGVQTGKPAAPDPKRPARRPS